MTSDIALAYIVIVKFVVHLRDFNKLKAPILKTLRNVFVAC
jgi:hypothetical protein